ncbi:MAG: hypothetical protein Kow0081_3610 [Candidatus Dojkabacteria bacterium]
MTRKDYLKLSLKQKAKLIGEMLKEDYPFVETPLIHKNEFELLIAATLSPQTKDETTNLVTPVLFTKYPDVEALAKAKPEDIEKIIKPINYYKTKAKRITALSKMLIKDFKGKVPLKMDDLVKLPGVGRKVANVVINEWFVYRAEKKGLADDVQPEGIVVDTHVLRVARRLGLTKNTDPRKVELDLMRLFPKSEWRKVSLRMIYHGREWSQAKNPKYKDSEKWRAIYGE